jgi:ABC-type lipoprotein export system ATPase subunit/bifunctional DNA-binding transcriptional regulator/antitoxin component of YhaV-PrlF toxin-antitoxin module
MTLESYIICDNLVKIYKIKGHDVLALQGLDLTVSKGELLGIVGVSGSGKSTLMNILGGLDRPTAGRVWVDSKDLLKLSDMALNQYRLSSVGFLWQQSARNLIPYLNAQENVEYPMTIAGLFGRKKRQRAERLLETVKLSERRYHALSELSGGEQQRVAMAVALANHPKLLLADEPTGEVDGNTAQVIYQIFRDLQREFELTTLIVSHDGNLAHYVDRVISIRDGKIATETVISNGNGSRNHDTPDTQENNIANKLEKLFEELIILDSAGRLQVPKELLEKFNMKGRVRLEAAENGVLIRPVMSENQGENVDALVDRLEQTKKPSKILEFVNRRFGSRGGAGNVNKS